MSVLKYWDTGTGAYRILSGPPGPANPYIVVTNLQTNPPNVNAPPVNPPNGLLVADTSVPDPTTAYLQLTGGALTGALTITAPAPELTVTGVTTQIVLNKTGGSNGNILLGEILTVPRWAVQLGDAVAETGGNVGSNFTISRYADTTGAFIDTPFTITRSSGAVSIKGTTTNDNAPAGYVGEFISSVIPSPGITLTNATVYNITNITLTPGDWDVSGEVTNVIGTGGSSFITCGLNNTSGTLPVIGVGISRFQLAVTFAASQPAMVSLAPTRVSIATSTTYYLVTYVIFGSGTVTAYGKIEARRVR